MGREDGYIGLNKNYQLSMRIVVVSDAVMYKAAYEKQLDVISGYGTDGRIKSYDLIVLADDRHIFPPCYAAPLVREETLQKFPELGAALNLLAGQINDSVMTALNYRADYLHESPEHIAKDFLARQGLWRPPRNGKKGMVRMGSKIFTEQYILSSMYAMLIKGYTDLEVVTKTGMGGTKICFDALLHNQIDVYPEYTGTGLLVILHPDEQDKQRLMTNEQTLYNFVQEAFQERFHIRWLQPIGFNNTYALMMRRQQAADLHITTITDLAQYLKK